MALNSNYAHILNDGFGLILDNFMQMMDNQDKIISKLDTIDNSIKNINTGATGPTEPDPGPTEPDEPDNPIPAAPKLKFSDTTNISNFSVKINDTIYTSDNWTPDLTIDITDGQNLNFEIWADNYYLFDTNPGIAITSNDNTKAVTLLPINGKYTGSTSLASTLTNDIILDIRAAAKLQPYNENDPTQPFDPLHPDTPALISLADTIYSDFSNGQIFVPAGFKIVKMTIYVNNLSNGKNVTIKGFKDGNIRYITANGTYTYHNLTKNDDNILFIESTDQVSQNLTIDYVVWYTPRTDISIKYERITSNSQALNNDYCQWISHDNINVVKLTLNKYANTSTIELNPDDIVDLSTQDFNLLSVSDDKFVYSYQVYSISKG